jgi:hypothetical protein
MLLYEDLRPWPACSTPDSALTHQEIKRGCGLKRHNPFFQKKDWGQT